VIKPHIIMRSHCSDVAKHLHFSVSLNYYFLEFLGSFGTKADAILIQDLSLYLQESGQIQVRTFQGTIKQTLPFTETEGPPITMAIGGDFFTCGTESGFLKIWHIGRREAKLHTTPRNLNDHIHDLGEIISANTNIDGTRVAFVVAKVSYALGRDFV
jgi:intraflagellar transport protein 140